MELCELEVVCPQGETEIFQWMRTRALNISIKPLLTLKLNFYLL